MRAAALTLSLLGCGSPAESTEQASQRVLGGIPAGEEFSGIVALLGSDSARLLCSGVLVSPDWVLTAGHCIAPPGAAPRAPQDILVVLGAASVMRAEPAQLRAVSAALAPFFDGDLRRDDGDNPEGLGSAGDIALLRLATPVADVRPEPLLQSAEVDAALTVGAHVTIGGYGLDNVDAGGVSGERRVADTLVGRRNATEFVAGGATQPDTCTGDSGGPAFVTIAEQRYAAGVASRGFPDQADCGEGGIYTLTSAFEDWITTEISNPTLPMEPEAEGGCSISMAARPRAAPSVGLVLVIACIAGRRGRRAALLRVV